MKIEDRIKVRRGLKLRNAAGTMIVDTRMGREHAIGANGELSCAPQPSALNLTGSSCQRSPSEILACNGATLMLHVSM